MAKNQKYAPKRTRVLPVATSTPTGTPLMVGSLPVITLTAEAGGGNDAGFATCALDGAWHVPVTTSTAIAVGGPVYITSGGALTPTATNNTLWGYAIEAKGTAAQTIAVEISQV